MAKAVKRTKLISLPKLLKKAQIVFNRWIRERDMEIGCISCGGEVQQAGHYFSQGQHSSLRFDEFNVNGQCIRCNLFLSGNLIRYGEGINFRYGTDIYVNLLAKSRNPLKKWTREELNEIINKYGHTNSKP